MHGLRDHRKKKISPYSAITFIRVYIIFFSFFSSCGKYLNAPKSAANDGKRAKEEAADATD